MKLAVIGAGAWGTALALLATRAGHEVTLWARSPEKIGAENPRLPGIKLPPALRVTGRLPQSADAFILAVPMQHLAPTLAALDPRAPLLLGCKGLETGTLRLPLEVAAAICPENPACVLTGPNFAAEIAAGLPAAAVIAGPDPTHRRFFIDALAAPAFRLYGNDDPLGAQLGGAAKNVYAIAAGVVIGAGQGENARAALITRGLSELSRMITALGGRGETAAGLSGMGDLVLTCTGPASRNFNAGLALGRGVPPSELTRPGAAVVEGIATAPALIERAAGIDLPICTAVADLLLGDLSIRDAMARLLGRKLRDE